MRSQRQEAELRNGATLVLTREAIVAAMNSRDYLQPVEESFRAHSTGAIALPEVVHIPGDHGAFHVKSAGFTDGSRYVAVKVNGNFPNNPKRARLPTIQGAIVLCSGVNGFPLAILDSTEVTAQRTGAATAVAAKHLAHADSKVAAIIGCGIQGRIQLMALLHVLALERAYAFDVDSGMSAAFAAEMSERCKLPVTAVTDFADATRRSQVIVTCTPSRQKFLERRHVSPGTFIAAVGADDTDKQELDPMLLGDSCVVVDVLEQCAQIGELHHALAAGILERSHVRAELGDIILDPKRGRTSRDEIVIFDSTGCAFQDVAAAAAIYERARKQQLGVPVRLA